MKLFKEVICKECDMEYKIIWDDDKFGEPCKCAYCGSDDIEINSSGFMA